MEVFKCLLVILVLSGCGIDVQILDLTETSENSDQKARVTISNSDSFSLSENKSSVFFYSISSPRKEDTHLAWEISRENGGVETDFVKSVGVATIPAGMTTSSLVVSPINDIYFEGVESFLWNFRSMSEQVVVEQEVTNFILNDDDSPPIASFQTASFSSTEGETDLEARIVLSKQSMVSIEVHYSLSGSATGTGVDYDLLSTPGVLTFDPMVTVQSISYQLVDDSVPDDGEQIIFEITSVKIQGEPSGTIGGVPVHTVTISDKVNTPPTLTGHNCGGTSVQDVNYLCQPTFMDPDIGDSHTWSLGASHNCSWLSINPLTGQISGMPSDDQVGPCTLSYQVSDNTGGTSLIQTIPWNVVNIRPGLVISDPNPIAEDSGLTIIRANSQVQATEEGFGVYSLISASGTRCEDHGSVSINPSSGEVSVSFNADYSGSCNINVQFDDENASNNIDTDEFRVMVVGQNDAPVIAYTCATTSLDEDVVYNCSGGEVSITDPDGGPPTWSTTVNHTCSWMTVNASTGALTGTPDDNDVTNPTCTVAIEATDGTDTSNEEAFMVAVTNVTPIFTIADSTINEDATATVIRTDGDVQSIDETLGTYSRIAASSADCHGANGVVAVDSTTGTVTYTPTANFEGPCNINIQFDDGNITSGNNTHADEFQVTFNASNDVPTISTHNCGVGATEDSPYSCDVTIDDLDMPSETASLQFNGNTCAWASISGSYPTFSISGTPLNNHVGACDLKFRAEDDEPANSATTTVNITVANNNPTLTIADLSIAEDAPLAEIRADGDVQASDEGQGDNGYTFDHAGTTGTKCDDNKIALTINSTTGAISYQPAASFAGTCNIKVSFDDAHSGTVDDEFTVTVTGSNDAPTITSHTCTTPTAEDALYSCTYTVDDVDVGDTVTLVTGAGHTCTFLGAPTGSYPTFTVSGTPDNSFVGTCVVEYKARDLATAESAVDGVNPLTITNVAPTFTIADAFINEDAPSAVIRADGTVQASDEGQADNGYAFDHASTTGAKCSDHAQALTINATNGEITYHPEANFIGPCNINVEFDDANGSVVDAQFTVNFTPSNDAPTITTHNCGTSATEDTLYTCDVTIDDLDMPSEVANLAFDSNACSWASITGSYPTFTVSGTPLNNHVATCDLRFRAEDDEPTNSATTIVSVVVGNNAPTLAIADTSIAEDAPSTVIRNDAAVQATDEGQAPTGYSLDNATTTGTKCSDNAQALTIDANTGAVTYHPAVDFSGTCNVKVVFDDAHGGVVNDEFEVTVTGSNDAPVIAYTCGTTTIDEDVAFDCSGGEVSLTDPDGGAPTWSFVEPAHTCDPWMTINPSTGALGGTPHDDQVTSPTCNVSVKANDTSADSNVVDFSVTVNNVQPTLTIADTSVAEDAALVEIHNDAAVQSSDETHGVYSLIAASSADCSSNGTTSIDSSTGAVSYDPDDNFEGPCNINVQFDDQNSSNNLVSDEFQVSITPSNDQPVVDISGCSTSGTQDVAYTCNNPTVNVTDPDSGDSHTWAFGGSHTCGGWLSINGTNGQLSGTPGDNDVGASQPCVVAVIATDNASAGNSASAEQTFNLTIANVAPTLTIADAADINENSSATEIRNDASVQASEEGLGVYSIIAASANDCNNAGTTGIVSIDASTGAVTYTPQAGYSGTCNINVQFDDQNGLGNSTVADEFQITVNDVGSILALDFRRSLPAEVTFTRSSTATYFDKDGVMQTAAVNQARIDHDPATGQPLGILIEGSRENLVLRSSEFEDVEWQDDASPSAVTANLMVSPDGTLTADLVEDDSPVNSEQSGQFVTVANDSGIYTASFFVKQATSADFSYGIYFSGGTTVDAFVHMDWVAGVPIYLTSAPSVISYGQKEIGNGWHRVWLTAANNASGNTQAGPWVQGVRYNATGAELGSLYVWGSQFEKASFPSSYIPTTTVAVTRSPELVETNDVAWYNSAKSTLLVNWRLKAPTAYVSSARAFSLSDGSLDSQLAILYHAGTDRSEFIYEISGSNEMLDSNGLTWVAGQARRTVSAVGFNDGAWYESGSLNTTDSSISAAGPDITRADIGTSFTGGNPLNGHIREIVYYPSRKANTTIEFASREFNILGVQGGNDTVNDQQLTDSAADIEVHWENVTGESGYSVTVYESDKTTVECATANIAADTTSHTFTGCNPIAGQYWVEVVATHADPEVSVPAHNGMMRVEVSANSGPVITSNCTPLSFAQDAAFSCNPSAVDPDTGDILGAWRLHTSNDCNWASITPATGVISGTPNDDEVGSCTLAFEVDDNNDNYSEVENYSITITNVTPTLTITDAANINEDDGATVIRADGDVQADEEGFGTYSVGTPSGTNCHGVNGTVSVNGTSGEVTYTPANNYNGTCNIRITFDDGNTGVISDDFAVTVDAVNDPPVITSSCSTSVTQDVAYTACNPGETNIDGPVSTWSFDTAGGHNCNWLGIDTGSGQITGTPDDDDVGTCNLRFKSNDGDDSNIEVYTVTISNLAPTLTIADAANILDNAGATVIRTDAEVNAGANEEGHGAYSVGTPTGANCNGANGTVTVNSSNGEVTYNPNTSYTGTCNIRIAFNDGNAGGVVSDDFSITVDPSGTHPSLALDFRTSLPSEVAFSRASTATYFDKNGVMRAAAVNEARIDHDPLTGETLGLLIEGTRTNELQRSEELDHVYWDHFGVAASVTPDIMLAPDGTMSVDLLDDVSAVSNSYIYKVIPISTTADDHTFSFYYKLGPDSNGLTFGIYFDNLAGSDCWAHWDNVAGNLVVSSQSAESGCHKSMGVKEISNGWYRVHTTSTSSAGDVDARAYVYADRWHSSGANEGSNYAWGLQFEEGASEITSYIPTTTSSATRQRDNVATNDVSWYDLTAGTIFTESKVGSPIARPSTAWIFSVSDGSNNELMAYAYNRASAKTRLTVRESNLQNVSLEGGAIWTSSGIDKGAFSFDSSEVRQFELGALVGNDTSVTLPASVTQADIGAAWSTGNNILGHIKTITYWPDKKSDPDMEFATQDFDVLGVTGGSDATQDRILTDASSNPTVHWEAMTGEDKYEVYIYEADLLNEKCSNTSVSTNSTSVTLIGCDLAPNQSYYVELRAINADGSVTVHANNSHYKFRVSGDATLALDFRTGLPSEVTFTRSSTATYFDKEGVLQTAPANQARFNHDPLTGQPLGVLIEESRTNLFTYSEDFNHSNWVKSDITFSSGHTAPDGSTNALKFLEGTATNAYHGIEQEYTTSGAPEKFAVSAFVKPDERTQIEFGVYRGSNFGNCDFDLAAGAVLDTEVGGSIAVHSCHIESLKGGWFRVVAVVTTSAHSDPKFFLDIQLPSDDPSYTGTSGHGIYVWGMQLEAADFSTSYIPTTSVAVARSADDLQTVDVSWNDETRGTFVSSFSVIEGAISHPAGNTYVLDLNNDSDNYISIGGVNDPTTLVTSAYVETTGDVQASLRDTAGWVANQISRSVFAYQANDFQHYQNDVDVGSDTVGTLPTGIDEMTLGKRFDETGYLNGHIQNVNYYAERKTNATVQFASRNFAILGVQGGSDTTLDQSLTDSSAAPEIHWENVTGETGYSVVIYAANKLSVECTITGIAANTASQTMAGCILESGDNYWVEVIAHSSDQEVSLPAVNGLMYLSVP